MSKAKTQTRLTDAQVAQIRKLYDSMTLNDLAAKFKCSASSIYKIHKGWIHKPAKLARKPMRKAA